ncbi:MAG: hypothetical protein K2X01_07075 [Cyanobacteria bacterium]|nr:hypothetical protein [Cyanobacteriota bacterium]
MLTSSRLFESLGEYLGDCLASVHPQEAFLTQTGLDSVVFNPAPLAQQKRWSIAS